MNTSSSHTQNYSLPSPSSPSSTTSSGTSISKKRSSKSHVPTACVNCKKAHLACDLSRPCKRCVSVGKTGTCYDIQHKKRGRPKLRDKRSAAASAWKHDKNDKLRSTQLHNNTDNNDNNTNNATSTSNSCTVISGTMTAAAAPAIAPGIANSSFKMTQPPGYQEPKEQINSMMTIFLSMDMRCARVSDEALEYLGLYPQQLAHRSLYDFLSSTNGLENIHRCLLDTTTANRTTSKITTTSDQFVTVSPSQLLSIANGSQTFKETLHFKQPNGTSYFDPLEARFYLGGGLGADLFVPSSLDHLYIVCLLTLKQRQQQQEQQQQSENNPLAILNDPAATTRPITPKQQEQLLGSRDELNAIPLGDPQQAFPWTSTTSSSPSIDNTDTLKLTNTRLSSSSNSTTTATSSSTALTERWNSDDETHQLVWMQPHDFVYAPQQQQQPKQTIDYTEISTTSTTTPITTSNATSFPTDTATIPSSWAVDQSDITNILTTTEYENMIRNIK